VPKYITPKGLTPEQEMAARLRYDCLVQALAHYAHREPRGKVVEAAKEFEKFVLGAAA